MQISGWDIANANAKQWNVTAGNHSVSNDSSWERGSPVPVMFPNEIGFKPLSITLLVYGEGREEIRNNRSMILAKLIEPVDLSLDNFEHTFFGYMTKFAVDETAMERWHKLTLEFNCYEYADEIMKKVTGKDAITVRNPGNILTPVILEVTPQIDIASISLSGICRDENTGADLPAVIYDLKKEETVVLDGETGLITQNAELKSADIWALPTLQPGENEIKTNNIWTDIKVRFRPRFM